MSKKTFINILLLTSIFSFSSQASAGLILDTYSTNTATPDNIGGFAMTDFSLISGTTALVSSVASPVSGVVNFVDSSGNELLLLQDTLSAANSSNSSVYTDNANSLWWENGESFDYNIYTTQQHWITILLPENTYAFSFNVGANMGARGWLQAEAYDGSEIGKTNFSGLGNPKAPGFAVYSDSSCSAIKSITVEPPFTWGVGNFSISQNSCSVPEPNILALFGLGLVGFGLMRRRKN